MGNSDEDNFDDECRPKYTRGTKNSPFCLVYYRALFVLNVIIISLFGVHVPIDGDRDLQGSVLDKQRQNAKYRVSQNGPPSHGGNFVKSNFNF